MSDKQMTSYLNPAKFPYPFCPGCGHTTIMDQLNAALVQLQLDPREVVVVVDIGCVALTREYFDTNWFLGLHGRSVTYATGIKLANPDLKVIVLMGDGGFGIGGHHVINAARRNIGITVLVFNNLNFGMTGGQHSVTTPEASTTSTTRFGNLERPLDVCATTLSNGASFVARTTTFEKNLSNLFAEAIVNDGFSVVDVWELCTSYYAPNNRFGRKQLESTLASLKFPTGILHRENRAEYSQQYRAVTLDLAGEPALEPRPLASKYENRVKTKLDCVIAGAAGKKVISTASAFCRGAVLSGLWVSQSNSYPVTVATGYSISNVTLSPEEILFTGGTSPDLMVVLSPEGLARAKSQVANLSARDTLYINSELLPVETGARTVAIDFGRASGAWARRKEYWTIMALAEVLRHSRLYPLEALKEAISERRRFAAKNLEAVEASTGIIVDG